MSFSFSLFPIQQTPLIFLAKICLIRHCMSFPLMLHMWADSLAADELIRVHNTPGTQLVIMIALF